MMRIGGGARRSYEEVGRQDADLVGFIFRLKVYKRDDKSLKGLAELILAKQRNGPVGKVDLVFLHSIL